MKWILMNETIASDYNVQQWDPRAKKHNSAKLLLNLIWSGFSVSRK